MECEHRLLGAIKGSIIVLASFLLACSFRRKNAAGGRRNACPSYKIFSSFTNILAHPWGHALFGFNPILYGPYTVSTASCLTASRCIYSSCFPLFRPQKWNKWKKAGKRFLKFCALLLIRTSYRSKLFSRSWKGNGLLNWYTYEARHFLWHLCR